MCEHTRRGPRLTSGILLCTMCVEAGFLNNPQLAALVSLPWPACSGNPLLSHALVLQVGCHVHLAFERVLGT